MYAAVVGRSVPILKQEWDIHLQCDLKSRKSVENLIFHLESLFKGGTTLKEFYWVSGSLNRIPFLEISDDQIINMIDVNFSNSILIARWVWKHLQSSRSPSSFVVIASTVGVSLAPRDDEAVYAATKAAQVSFTRAIGKQNKNPSLKTCLFCPGGMKTDFWKTNAVERSDFESFLDPVMVARKVVTEVTNQKEGYLEMTIPRGSL